MCAAFNERRKIIVEELNSVPGFSCQMPKGAFYAFANISGTGITAAEFQDRMLNEASVATIAGTSFGRFGEGYVRFSYANSRENIKAAIGRIQESL